jgi:RNA polymerase sigma-70 factor (ECF subfamily)
MQDGQNRKLVEAYLRGDREAYNDLVELHADRVYAICLAMVGSEADAEDLAEEALVTGFMKIASLRDHDRFGSWIATIAANLSRNFIRIRANRERLLEARPDCAGGETESVSDLRNALGRLPERFRIPLVLYYFDGRSTENIAAALDISPEAVRMRLSRARGELRKLLEKAEAHDERRMQ